MTSAERAAETRRKRRETLREQHEALRHDREAALALCRRVRDDEGASDETRLRAVELLLELTEGAT